MGEEYGLISQEQIARRIPKFAKASLNWDSK
jgi:hypothetical protein